MRHMAFCIVLALATSALVAQTPAQWPTTPTRNMVVQATGLPDRIGPDNLLWSHQMGGKGESTFGIPIITKDRVVCVVGRGGMPMGGRDGGLVIFSRHTGEILLEKAIPGLGGGYAADAPIIEDGKLYTRRGDTVVCMDLEKDGQVVWESDAVARWGIRRCHGPNGVGVILGDYYWIPTCGEASEWSFNYDELTMERPWKPLVVVLNKHTGELVAMDEVLQKRYYHGQWASLSAGVVNGKQMVFYGDGYGYLRAFEAPEKFESSDGEIVRLKEVWYADANPKEYRYFESGTEKPYVNWDKSVRIPYDPKSQEAPCEIISAAVFHEGLLYVALARDYMYCKRSGRKAYGPGAMLCVDPTGEGDVTQTHIKWMNKDVPRTFSTASIVGDLLFISDLAGNLHCLDVQTGEHHWKHDIETKIWNYPQVVADGKIYLQNEAGKYFILAASKEKKVLFETELEGRNGMATGVANGMIVVVTPKRIAAYKGPGYQGPEPTAVSE